MWLGIDLGTSSVKASLFGPSWDLLGRARAPYSVEAPQDGWAESDPEAWWQSAVSAARAAVGTHGSNVRAIGLSGQMHGVVLARSDGSAVRPAVLWADTRSSRELAAYDDLSRERRRALANPLVVGMAGPTLLWLCAHEPAAYAEARWALLPKDWLRLRLTGRAATEPSDASGTLLYDLARDDWAHDVIEALELRGDLLPALQRSDSVAGTLTHGAAEILQLPAGIPVATGAADTAAAIHGSGLGIGDTQLTVGTGAQIVTVTNCPSGAPERGLHLYRAAHEGRWYRMAAMQNAGLALEWARGVLGLDWPEMYRALAATAPGSDGLLFLPYLTGERTPHLNADARAGWLMASRRHTRDHFARAALEGVAFAIADGFAALFAEGAAPDHLRLAGGGARERSWQQLLADVLGVPLEPGETVDASVVGAARLAAAAQGQPLPTAYRARPAHAIHPHDGDQRPLADAHHRFREAYERLFT